MERLRSKVVSEDAEEEPDQTGNDEIHKVKLALDLMSPEEPHCFTKLPLLTRLREGGSAARGGDGWGG